MIRLYSRRGQIALIPNGYVCVWFICKRKATPLDPPKNNCIITQKRANTILQKRPGTDVRTAFILLHIYDTAWVSIKVDGERNCRLFPPSLFRLSVESGRLSWGNPWILTTIICYILNATSFIQEKLQQQWTPATNTRVGFVPALLSRENVVFKFFSPQRRLI